MLLIREFEVRTMQAYQDKKIGGFCHIYIGQEAVAVGCTAAVQHADPVVTAYRDHGHALARGMDPKYCMAEMFGRIGGCAKGKGGSMHMFDKPNNLFGGHGIVGAQTPLGAGLAFAKKYQDEVIEGGVNKHVTLCFLGDGALNQGGFYEAMNLASLFDIPGDLRGGEQRLLDGHLDRAWDVDVAPHHRQGRGMRAHGVRDRRHGRRHGVRRDEEGRGHRSGREPAGDGRSADLPFQGPLDVGPTEVPDSRRGSSTGRPVIQSLDFATP